MDRQKSVLVTGGAGFLGSHLCEYLLGKGHYVICMDNFFTGNAANVRHLRNNPNFELLRHDVRLPVLVEVDQIYNLACPASPVHYQKNAVETLNTSILGGIHMLEASRRSGARILQASTSEVYGDPHVHPQPETYWGNVNPIGPRACYDEGKRVAEALFFSYHHEYDVDIRVVRIFNTYGPRMALHDGRVVSNFIVQALTNTPMTIYGDGEQTRSFCYVSDLIEGIYLAMQKEDFLGPVNLGNPRETSMLELARTIIRLTESKSELKFEPLPSDDPRQRQPDISLAGEVLGWTPKVLMEEGLTKTVQYFREVLNDKSR
jgi:UDP-glucuronate decarboxylase